MGQLADRVYSLLKQVPKGKTTTYKILAQKAGTKAYRAVGQILRKNPYFPQAPCHRVVASDGTIGGFGGTREGKKIAQKKTLLKKEGIEFKGNKIKNFNKVLFKFK